VHDSRSGTCAFNVLPLIFFYLFSIFQKEKDVRYANPPVIYCTPAQVGRGCLHTQAAEGVLARKKQKDQSVALGLAHVRKWLSA
jgi:hypothetical protein